MANLCTYMLRLMFKACTDILSLFFFDIYKCQEKDLFIHHKTIYSIHLKSVHIKVRQGTIVCFSHVNNIFTLFKGFDEKKHYLYIFLYIFF